MVSTHRQPKDTQVILDKFAQLPRRANATGVGFDGVAMIVVECDNNGGTVAVRRTPPAPAGGSTFNYDNMIHRVAGEYATRFAHI